MALFLKDYTLQEVIHSSAFTTIYRGIKNDDLSPVTIKIVKPEFIQDNNVNPISCEIGFINSTIKN